MPLPVEGRADVPPAALLRVITVIDAISVWSGKLFAWLIIPLIGGLSYEVFARYLFSAPTDWAFDITYMLYGSYFMLGAAYTLREREHIRTDFFYNGFSVRRQALIDAVCYLVFFPAMTFFLLSGWDEALRSWTILERSDASPWRPPVYPFKTVIPAAALLLLGQGVSEFLKSLYALARGKWL